SKRDWRSDVCSSDLQDPAAQTLLQQLAGEGVDVDAARALLRAARYQPKIVAAMRSPAESTMTWARYGPIFLDDKRIQNGATFITRHADIFAAVENAYGVPEHVISAIIGVETRYGAVLGKHRVLDALATLAFDYPPRAKFFSSELGHFIQLCVEEQLDCRHESGSYAGAMGLPQFMPSSYRAYAVDFNNNGRRDLWNEPHDIIASVANYLRENGWRPGMRVALPATITDHGALAGLQRSTTKPHYSWADLHAAGIRVDHPPAPDTRVGLLEYDGKQGKEY